MNRLEGKTALITGAGMGIGLGIAHKYAREGANIVIAEHNEEASLAAAKAVEAHGIQSLSITTDVCIKEQVDAAVQAANEAFGGVDILVNNAWGGGSNKRFESKTVADMEHGLRMGAMSSFYAMQAVFPYMKMNGGSIINMCSLNGVNAHMYSAEYNAGKEALRAITRTAAREWAQYQIRCNIICPAAASEAYKQFAKHNPENAAAMLPPLGRMGDPEQDIGGVALFLASEDSAYLTGNTLFVDGGGHINGVAWAPSPTE